MKKLVEITRKSANMDKTTGSKRYYQNCKHRDYDNKKLKSYMFTMRDWGLHRMKYDPDRIYPINDLSRRDFDDPPARKLTRMRNPRRDCSPVRQKKGNSCSVAKSGSWTHNGTVLRRKHMKDTMDDINKSAHFVLYQPFDAT